jgi:hypothetical protein
LYGLYLLALEAIVAPWRHRARQELATERLALTCAPE